MIESRRFNHSTMPPGIVTVLVSAAVIFTFLFLCLLVRAVL